MSKTGRPIVEGLARQARLAARAERVAANGGVVRRGRPAKAKDDQVTEDQVTEEQATAEQN